MQQNFHLCGSGRLGKISNYLGSFLLKASIDTVKSFDNFCSVGINDSKIIQSNGEQIIIQDFWYYDKGEWNN